MIHLMTEPHLESPDEWWMQQDQEEQQVKSLSDRAKELREEALRECDNSIPQAMGWLSMALALLEVKVELDDRDKEIEHLNKIISILENKS